MLAVVQDQQRRRAGEVAGDPGPDVGPLLRGEAALLADRVAHPDRRAHLTDHVLRRRDAGQLHEPHDRQPGVAAQHVRETGLAEPAGPDDRDDPGAGQQPPQRADVRIPAEQRRGVVADAVVHRVVGGEQLAVHLDQHRSRTAAQPVGDGGAVALEPFQRGRRAADRRLAAQQVGEDVLVGGPGARLGLEQRQRLGVLAGAAERHRQHPGGRRRPRQRERVAGRLHGGVQLPALVGGACGLLQVRVRQHIDLVATQPEPVPAGGALDDARLRRRADPGHQHLQRLRRVRGPVLAPDRVDQGVRRATARARLGQGAQQRARAVADDGFAAPANLVEQRQRTGHPISLRRVLSGFRDLADPRGCPTLGGAPPMGRPGRSSSHHRSARRRIPPVPLCGRDVLPSRCIDTEGAP